MKRYARVCDITKEGMDEGWIWYGGTFYTKYEKDTVQELHKDFDDEWGSRDWSDDKILEYAFEADILYWTEWEDFDDDDCWGPEKTENN
jgi:hypothetical protein